MELKQSVLPQVYQFLFIYYFHLKNVVSTIPTADQPDSFSLLILHSMSSMYVFGKIIYIGLC